MSKYDMIPYNKLDINNPAPRCPVVLLLDTSSSMYGAPIAELNNGIRQFLKEVREDEVAASSVELEIITFDNTARVQMPFTEISKVMGEPNNLRANGMTSMGAAFTQAWKDLNSRRKNYKNCGISCYRPWVILMTDGGPNDEGWLEAAMPFKKLGEEGKIQYIGIGIGEDADFETLSDILPSDSGPIKLKGLSFREFFRWLSDSLRSVSSSAVSEQDNIAYADISDWADL